MTLVGARAEVEVGAIAHGGHCVARLDGRVVFVRHALPGERVVVEVTEGEEDSRFLRADAVRILAASPDRVEPPCPVARPGGCGGCDFQHVEPAAQRRLLAQVVQEQLVRLAGLERDVAVEPVSPDGLGWRTRMTFAVDPEGRAGLRKHRSHDVMPLDTCPIASPELTDVFGARWEASRVSAVASSTGEREVLVDGKPASVVHERVGEHEFEVDAGGFWQVHPAAASTLVDAVLEYGRPRTGERVADLYAGVGLFSAFLADAVGPDGAVVSVEGDRRASRHARRNLPDGVDVRHGPVERVTASLDRCDLVVLDPPRTGARAKVVRAIASLQPSRVVYVACDPAALARDVRTFGEHGYALAGLRAFDLFPMTQHVECVALLTRA